MTLVGPHAVDAVHDTSARSQLREAVALFNDPSSKPQLIAGGQQIALPGEVVEAFRDILRRFANGESIVIGSLDSLLTTSQAAEFLGVSRTFVIQLIEAGKLGVEYRGTHRRVPLADAARYLEEAKRGRQEKLDSIAALSARTGGYDGDPF